VPSPRGIGIRAAHGLAPPQKPDEELTLGCFDDYTFEKPPVESSIQAVGRGGGRGRGRGARGAGKAKAKASPKKDKEKHAVPEIVGLYHYGADRSYEIKQSEDKLWYVSSRSRGELVAEGDFWVAQLSLLENGEAHGTIRLRNGSEDGQLISNLRTASEKPWAKDTIATKQVTSGQIKRLEEDQNGNKEHTEKAELLAGKIEHELSKVLRQTRLIRELRVKMQKHVKEVLGTNGDQHEEEFVSMILSTLTLRVQNGSSKDAKDEGLRSMLLSQSKDLAKSQKA
jgi:hypothetical protein